MGLRENMLNEPVRRLALREPVVCEPQETIRAAVEKMRERQLGCVIVVDQRVHPVGIFTEAMLTQLLVKNPGAVEEKLEVHMATRWPWVKDEDVVADVMAAMMAHNIRFLAVVDADGKLVGLTGQKGLMEYIAEHCPQQVMVQRVGCSPAIHEREGA